MPKTEKQKPSAEKALLATMPWACTNFGNTSEIDAYVEQTGKWETIAETHSVGDILDAEDIASFIVSSANSVQEMHVVLKQALVSLEACVACKGVEQKVRQSAEKAINNIKKISS